MREPAGALPREPGATAERGGNEVPADALVAAAAADDKLGQDTVILEMGELLGVIDAFVITSGSNVRQVRTLAEEIESRVKADGGPAPSSVEGLRDATWILMDYGDFIVHVFLRETRDYYDLEHLWAGAARVDWRQEATTRT